MLNENKRILAVKYLFSIRNSYLFVRALTKVVLPRKIIC